MRSGLRDKLSWISYDFANSAFVFVVGAVAFPIFYRDAVLEVDPATADQTWGFIVALTMFVAGLLSPGVGALADLSGGRRVFLIMSTLVACASAVCMYFLAPGKALFGGFLFVVGQVAWVISTFLYDSYLRSISGGTPSHALSGVGWGLGYAGGIACYFLTFKLFEGGVGVVNQENFRTGLVITGLFYLFFSLPTMLFLPRAGDRSLVYRKGMLKNAYERTLLTLMEWKKRPQLMIFLLGFYCINNGIITTIYFMAPFLGSSFGMDMREILLTTVLIQAIGIISTPAFGFLADHWSEKGSLLISIGFWIAAVLLMAFGRFEGVPDVLAVLIGACIGSTQSLCRGVFAKMVPENRAGEFFGFHAFAGRMSAVFGPLLFGLISSVTGSQRLAMLSLLVFFVAGAIILAIGITKGPHSDSTQPVEFDDEMEKSMAPRSSRSGKKRSARIGLLVIGFLVGMGCLAAYYA